MRILILGGTSEAIDLAEALTARRHKVTTSLAGRTRLPRRPPGRVIRGSLGGAGGLAAKLIKERYDYLIDATHPFATKISANAVSASKAADMPLLRILRPPWTDPGGTAWWNVDDPSAAAELLPVGSTVLLTIGRQMLEPFTERRDCRFVVRSIEPPDIRLPREFEIVRMRPPFGLQDELKFFRHKGITHLISKNSGGAKTHAKIEAAYILNIQTIMIARPELVPAETVPDVASALQILDHLPAPERRSFFLPLLRNMWAKPES